VVPFKQNAAHTFDSGGWFLFALTFGFLTPIVSTLELVRRPFECQWGVCILFRLLVDSLLRLKDS